MLVGTLLVQPSVEESKTMASCASRKKKGPCDLFLCFAAYYYSCFSAVAFTTHTHTHIYTTHVPCVFHVGGSCGKKNKMWWSWSRVGWWLLVFSKNKKRSQRCCTQMLQQIYIPKIPTHNGGLFLAERPQSSRVDDKIHTHTHEMETIHRLCLLAKISIKDP